MPQIENRKYEKILADGRVVSRQRYDQIQHPEADRARQAKWRASRTGKTSKHEAYLRYNAKRKANGGRPLNATD